MAFNIRQVWVLIIGEYVKKWVPELKNVSVKDILGSDVAWKKHKGVYIKPIVDHATTAKLAKEMLKGETVTWE